MGLCFSAGELARFVDLASGARSEIFLKLDSEGFILKSSMAIEALETCDRRNGSRLLIAPRLADLVDHDDTRAVGTELALAAAGNAERNAIEIRLATGGDSSRWFSLRLSPMKDADGVLRVLAVLKDVHERRILEDKLFAARMTDPLTGLTNRVAFDAMLKHVTQGGLGGCLALFNIDHFRAINHRLGHDFGDQVLIGFAEVLRAVLRTGDTISRIGDATFAVLFLDTDHVEASRLARQVQQVFEGTVQAGKHDLPLSCKAGIAEIGTCAPDTLKRAEIAMFLGKAGGRDRPAIEREYRRARPLPKRLPPAIAEPLLRAG